MASGVIVKPMRWLVFAAMICISVQAVIVQKLFAQELKYTVSATGWNSDSLGNHRVVVHVDTAGIVNTVVIPWRRRDDRPEEKNIIVEDARTHGRVMNVKRDAINREFGKLFFEPTSGAGDYYVYYMPYKSNGRSNYPNNTYPKPEQTADSLWLRAVERSPVIPKASVVERQSIDELSSFYPMEVIATTLETRDIIQRNADKTFLVFPEDRLHPIKMTKDLPQRWILEGNKNSFSGEARRGEYFAFQLGVYAIQDLEDARVTFSDLVSSSGKSIPADSISCINLGGINWNGQPMAITVNVPQNRVQALWCGIDVPQKVEAGLYNGIVTVSAKGRESQRIDLSLIVNDTLAVNGGVDQPWKQTRLKWLNSTLAQKNDVIAPYTPLILKESTISLLGRKVLLNNDGFPKQIQTFFTPEMTSISKKPKNILRGPMGIVIEDESGIPVKWTKEGLKFVQVDPGTVSWTAVNTSAAFRLDVHASLEFDGFVSYTVAVTALKDIAVNDIRMVIPVNPGAAEYMMGLGQKGGFRPEKFEWVWDVTHKNQDGAWIGDVNAGLLYSLRAENYSRPLNTNFYLQKPLNLPPSWGNEGKGGVRILPDGHSVIVNNYSGSRQMKKGEVLYYSFTLLITPFHTIDTDFQWSNRFYHKYSPVDTVIANGANIINIHHATKINPYINYPFIAYGEMKEYIDEAHRKGLKVKIYNTVRELSNRAYELFPLRSLGHEIYSPGRGGGFSWLQEHLGEDYIPAWFVPELKDAAIVNSGMSRWHNYYVEGMNWLVQNVGIDGLYLDDVVFDRTTMKRIKRVLTQDGHPGIIDLHSANQYNKNDGFINSACLYMEHFPYLNRLWFGEYFDYENNSPEFFLTEVSGIPFGLMGEMLQGGGNPWRGMVYGMTNRMPWTENSNPRPIWKVWDEFGMTNSQMIGYWVENNPVTTDNKDVPVTVYKKKGKALIALASWAKEDVVVKLRINWKALGLQSSHAKLTAPAVESFQPAFTIQPTDTFTVPKGKGYLLILSEL